MSNELYVNDYNINGYLPPSQYPIAMSSSSLGYFLGKCTKSDFFKDIGNGFTQGLNFVNFIRVYPYNVMDTQYTETDVPIPIGNTSVTISQDTTLKRIVGTTKSKLHITKEFTIIKDITKFYESYPYTQVDCYLPYVGFTSLDINELKASNGKIKVDLVIDIVSGSGIYSISRYDTSLNGYYVFYTCTTNFATDVSIGGANSTEINKKLFNSTAQLGIMIGTTALSFASFSAGMTGVGMYSAFKGLQQGGNLLGTLPETMQQTLISRGQNGNFPSSINNPHAIYFIIKTRKINDYDSFKSVYGKPLNQSVNLSTLEGITFIPNPKLEIPNITSNEYEELISLMQNGIILSQAFDKLEVSNVSINGTYYVKDNSLKVSDVSISGSYMFFPQLEVSDVSISGSYMFFPQLKVSDVSISGSYMFFPQLEVSDVSISGSYEIQDTSLNISDVSLSGTYLVYDSDKINVSNVTLSGSYEYYPQVIVSNVKLSGSYDVAKISVSNVKLSGSYDVAKISVSNVKLSGTYKVYTPSSYTLNFFRYVNGSLYDLKTFTIDAGTTIYPSIYANAYVPSPYELSSYSPTSSFVMNSNQTIRGYYTNHKLIVSNVKLSGSYELSKIVVSSVKLSGSYEKNIDQPIMDYEEDTSSNRYKVYIRNPNSIKVTSYRSGSDITTTSVNIYANSFTYFFVDMYSSVDRTYECYFTDTSGRTSITTTLNIPKDNKVRVTNVSLSGKYTIKKVIISNVKISGTYKTK